MKEFATAVAGAMHQPDKLEQMFRPSVNELVSQARRDPGAFEQDEWWRRQA